MAKTWTPKRVRSDDDRGGSSDFITLDEGEKFLGYALFAGDPAKDEPGYYEFLQHWVGGAKGGRSVPCAGDDCPYCEDGDKPRDVAFTLWKVTRDEKGNDLGDGELRIFRANSITIKQLTEMRSEDEPIKGIQFRVTRMDDRGNYMLQAKPKKLTAAQVKEALGDKDAPNFDQMVTNTLRKAMEGVSVARAMDEDEDEPAEPTGRKGGKGAKGGKNAAAAEPDGDWPDDGLDELAVTVAKIEKDGNWIEVTHDDYEGKVKVWTTNDIKFDLSDLSKDDEVTVTASGPDDDGEYILTDEPTAGGASDAKEDVEDIEDETLELLSVSQKNKSITVEWKGADTVLVAAKKVSVEGWRKGHEGVISAAYDADEDEWTLTSLEEVPEPADPDAEPEDAKADLPDAIEDEEFEVVSIDTDESTIEVKGEELEFTLYFLDKGPASKVDFDDYEVGSQIKVSAEKDSVGDMVATAIPEVIEAKGAKGGRKGAAAKGGKGKS